MKILLIQSNLGYLQLLDQMLRDRHHVLEIATDGLTGLAKGLHARFDLILLDTDLPCMDGLSVIQRLRQENDSTPILLVSQRGESSDKMRGFYAGADDYMVIPGDPDELIARMHALHRRRTGGFNAPSVLRVDNFELNVAEKAAYRLGQYIRLTAYEFKLLEFLVKNTGRFVTQQQILEKVWDNTAKNKNEVSVYINFLRNKIDRDFEPKLIHTIKGLGYVFRVEVLRNLE